MVDLYAIKTEIRHSESGIFEFPDQKTMYGGKRITAGDKIYLFASENQRGIGLVAQGIVTASRLTPRTAGIERKTPRVSITVRRTALAKGSLGRKHLRPHDDWTEGRPETELNFKLYRQATNKIVGLSEEAIALLECHF